MARKTANTTIPPSTSRRTKAEPAAAKSSATPANHLMPQSVALPSEDAIRHCAYLKWEAAGRPGGDGVSFWLEAEQELCRTAPG